MTKIVSVDVLEKIIQILLSNQNKINLLRNDLGNNLLDGNNTKKRTNQFLNGLEIDIKNILSLLNREKIDINKNNPNEINKTYCLNNDKNIFQDIVICGCCECCKCQKCCDCSTNNCSENQQLNISNNLQNQNNRNNDYIKENINLEEDDKNSDFSNKKNFNNEKNLPNYNFQPPSPRVNKRINNNYTNPNFNYDDIYNNKNINNNNYRTLNPDNEPNLNLGNNQGNLINPQLPYYSNNYNNNDSNNLNDFPKQFGYIKKQPFNNMDIDDDNIPIHEKIKNSAIMKSKRFHNSRSFDNIESPLFPNKKKAKIIKVRNNNNPNEYKNNDNNFNNIINPNFNPNLNPNFNNFKNNNNNLLNMNGPNKDNFSNKKNKRNNNIYNNNYDNNNVDNLFNNKRDDNNNNNLIQKKKKMDKMNNIQNFLNKLYKQPKEIINRFKIIYGDDIEEKLLNGDISNDNLNEMENILDKIIKMSIWGKDDNKKNKKRGASSSLDRKTKRRKQNFVYNPVQEKIKLMTSIKDKQAYFREFPRGWYSTKEYFINNGTEINNENINKYV